MKLFKLLSFQQLMLLNEVVKFELVETDYLRQHSQQPPSSNSGLTALFYLQCINYTSVKISVIVSIKKSHLQISRIEKFVLTSIILRSCSNSSNSSFLCSINSFVWSAFTERAFKTFAFCCFLVPSSHDNNFCLK